MRIGELAQRTGVTTATLRYYEDEGLLPRSARTPSGYRDYTAEVVGTVGFIRRGQTAGLTLAQIKQIIDIRGAGLAPCDHVRDLLDDSVRNLDRQIAELTALRQTIVQLREAAENVDPQSCDAEVICGFL